MMLFPRAAMLTWGRWPRVRATPREMAESCPTRQRRTGPSISTSLTPDARSICRAGGAPTKLTSTRRTG